MRHRALAVLAVSLVAASSAIAGSPAEAIGVGGFIDEDTTWGVEDSPIVLEGPVVVSRGATLTIEPGVEVRGTPGARLVVAGVLHAVGTRKDPIVFTSNHDDKRWRGIRFLGQLRTMDLRSRLSHVDISRAVTALDVWFDSPRISRATLRRNATAIDLTMPTAAMTIDASRFFHNHAAITGRTASIIEIRENDFWANDLTLLLGPKRPQDCVRDNGAWLVRHNDILRGPDQEWDSDDVATTPDSYESPFIVKVRRNHWGTQDRDDVEGRLLDDDETDEEPYLRKDIQPGPLSPDPETPWTPPGDVNDPERGSIVVTDPATTGRVIRPRHGGCYQQDDLSLIRGEAHSALIELESVRVAVLRRTQDGCTWLIGAEAHFEPRACNQPLWLRPRGLEDWRFRLDGALPAGRYEAWLGTNDGSSPTDVNPFTVRAAG